MKGRDEIIGLRIVNIQTAMEVGSLKDIVLDPVSKGIAYYVLDEPSDYLGARLINQKYAVGLGDFALTVMGEDIIEGVAHCPWAIELLRSDVQVIGTYALSDKGLLLGVVNQIFFDETTGSIVRCRIQNDEGRIFDVDGTDIVTLGGSFTILLEDSVLIEVEYIEDQDGEHAEEGGVDRDVRMGAGQDGIDTDEMDFDPDQAEVGPDKVDFGSDQDGVGTNEAGSASDKADLDSGKIGFMKEKKAKEAKEAYGVASRRVSMGSSSEAFGTGERSGVWRKELVGQEAYRAAQYMSCDAVHNMIHDAAHTNSIFREDSGPHGEGDTGSGYAGPGRALEVSARPLSAAEAALVKAAEALRRKAAQEAAQEKSIEPFRETEAMNKDDIINKNNQVKGQVNRIDKVEDIGLNCGISPVSEKDNEDICGADSFKSWGTVAKGSKTEGADMAVKMPVNTDRLKDTDKAGGRNWATDRDGNKDKDKDKDEDKGKNGVMVTNKNKEENQEMDEDTKGRRGHGERPKNADVVKFPDSQKSRISESGVTKNSEIAGISLAAAEIIYPKGFNHFDKRQMQYLLGKRLSQAVQLENGEIMREGEYITAEMLSLVRTRETLMELTMHIRRS